MNIFEFFDNESYFKYYLCTFSLLIITGFLIYYKTRSYVSFANTFSYNNREANRNNSNNNNNNFQNNCINVTILFENRSLNFNLSLNSQIQNFIINNLKPSFNINNETNLVLLSQGRRLETNKQFNEYSSIREGSIIHCFKTNSSASNNNNQQNEDNREEKGVFLGTIVIHLTILFVLYLTFQLNGEGYDVITKPTMKLIKIFTFIWLVFFCKSLALLLTYKKIIF